MHFPGYDVSIPDPRFRFGMQTSLNGSYETGDSTFNPLRYWGQLSPFYSVPKGAFGLANADPEIPQGCSLTQVCILASLSLSV